MLRQTEAVYQFRHLRLRQHLGHAFRERHQRRYAPARFTLPRAATEPHADLET
ncbi:hypothetical protein [Streptacidiphilus melanogenes]|uniref:hypothetical protein n=1 Tax=Streptacidiphilus melanogenes TaxID=411235 RepID=UPI000A93397B